MRMFSGFTSRWMHCRNRKTKSLHWKLNNMSRSLWLTVKGECVRNSKKETDSAFLSGGLVAFVVSRWYINYCSAKGKEFLFKKKKRAVKETAWWELEEGGDQRNSKKQAEGEVWQLRDKLHAAWRRVMSQSLTFCLWQKLTAWSVCQVILLTRCSGTL